MSDFQAEKQIVRKYFKAVDSGASLDGLVAPDYPVSYTHLTLPTKNEV